eukprot:592195-Prorocentrum_minimum.AAC.1
MWDPNFELEPNAKRRMQEFARTGKFSPGMQPGLALRADYEASLLAHANHPSSPCAAHVPCKSPGDALLTEPTAHTTRTH